MFWGTALVLAMLGGSSLQLYYYLIALCVSVCARANARLLLGKEKLEY